MTRIQRYCKVGQQQQSTGARMSKKNFVCAKKISDHTTKLKMYNQQQTDGYDM